MDKTKHIWSGLTCLCDLVSGIFEVNAGSAHLNDLLFSLQMDHSCFSKFPWWRLMA